MKHQEAIARGFSATGFSDLSDIAAFNKAREGFKKAGYKTLIVNERTSKYSRGNPGCAYRTLYVEQRYRDDEALKRYEQELDGLAGRGKAAEEAFKAELQKISERGVELEAMIAEWKAKNAE